MKRFLQACMTAGIFSIASSAAAGDVYLGLGGGATDLHHSDIDVGGTTKADADYGHGAFGALKLGYDSKGMLRWELEKSLSKSGLENVRFSGGEEAGSGSTKATALLVNLWVDLGNDAKRLQPYLGGGLGIAEIKASNLASATSITAFSDDDLVGAGQIGAGLRWEMLPRLQGSLDYRYFLATVAEFDSVNSETEFGEHRLGIGFNWLLGGPKSCDKPERVALATAKEDADADGDGVIDGLDQCPATAAGSLVDAKGCALVLDSDADGVADAADQCPGTPAGKPVMTNGCAERQKITLRSVQFEYKSTQLTAAAQSRLQRVVDVLKASPGFKVRLNGHTDNVGSEGYNQKLSQRRADSVRSFLISRGVKPAQVSARGFGETRPMASNQSDRGRALNRRVVLEVMGQE